MRKLIVLLLGLGLSGFGLYLLYLQMFEATAIKKLVVFTGSTLLFCGVGLLYEGFVVGIGPKTPR
jgi:hypothetical protein